ncbi:hypothetical protein P7C70_g9325, partial [Phenoliferia sp. Uapishka_3]
PTWNPSPGEDPKEANSSDSSDDASLTVAADSPAKNLRPRVASTSKRARVPDSESEGDGGNAGSSSSKSPVFRRTAPGLIRGRPDASGSSRQGPFSLPVHDEQQNVNSVQIGKGEFQRALEIENKVNPNNSAILHLVSELIKVDGYISEKVEEGVEEKEAAFEVERRTLLAKVDELGHEFEKKCRVAVVEAEEKVAADKDREWRGRRQAEIEERQVFGSKLSQFCTVQLLGVIREELLDVDPKGDDSHDLEVASILRVFALILEAEDEVSVEGRLFLDGILGKVYDREISIEDFETAFMTRSFLETPRWKGKGKAKISEVDREEDDGMEKDQLEDDFPMDLLGRS